MVRELWEGGHARSRKPAPGAGDSNHRPGWDRTLAEYTTVGNLCLFPLSVYLDPGGALPLLMQDNPFGIAHKRVNRPQIPHSKTQSRAAINGFQEIGQDHQLLK